MGPYVEIDLSRKFGNSMLIDGIYISPHKFLGGLCTNGMLIMNKNLYNTNNPPNHGGGGTVDYVSTTKHAFVDNIQQRESSGTPGIIEMIKCGHVFNIKEVCMPLILKRE